MKKVFLSSKFYLRWALTILTLALGLYLVISAKNFFASTEASRLLSLFTGHKYEPLWKWCPEEPKILSKSNKINKLEESDLSLICALKVESASAEEVQKLKGAEVLLQVEGSKGKRSVLKATEDLGAFEIDQLPFKNQELTGFLRTKKP